MLIFYLIDTTRTTGLVQTPATMERHPSFLVGPGLHPTKCSTVASFVVLVFRAIGVVILRGLRNDYLKFLDRVPRDVLAPTVTSFFSPTKWQAEESWGSQVEKTQGGFLAYGYGVAARRCLRTAVV